MENQLWNLFLETGDPMGYLLYKAGKNSEETDRTEKKTQRPPTGTSPPSV